jgi:hypothetical protein
MRLVNPLTIVRIAFVPLLTITMAGSTDKTPPTYEHGTITGWNMKYYPGGMSAKHKFYELKGGGMIYQIDSGGAFRKCGPFQPEQAVEYRVEDKFVYIHTQNGKEDKCGITGAKTDAPPTAP